MPAPCPPSAPTARGHGAGKPRALPVDRRDEDDQRQKAGSRNEESHGRNATPAALGVRFGFARKWLAQESGIAAPAPYGEATRR